MHKLLIGTNNPAKAKEIRDGLAGLPFIFLTPKDIGILDAPEETGKTFEENSWLKANFYAKISRLPTLADDGGLEIDALNGWPGIHSHRMGGTQNLSDEELIARVLNDLRDVEKEKRTARFRVFMTLAMPDGRALMDSESLEGEIAEKASEKREHGYPYRSIFWLSQYEKYFVELSPDEIKECSHRSKLVQRLGPKIVKMLES